MEESIKGMDGSQSNSISSNKGEGGIGDSSNTIKEGGMVGGIVVIDPP